jgi:protein-S-isoprenylcysteine O-methyltransferase Ste14
MRSFLLNHLDVSLVVVGFLLYLLLWFIKKKELLKLAGINANVLFKATRPIQIYFGVMEKIMTWSIMIIIILHYILPDNLFLTRRLFGMHSFVIKIIGVVLGISGLIICRIAQITIGKSWRVGIDENINPGLVTAGIYSMIRNPTYTGLFLLCAGLFVILPTVLFSYWILVFFIIMEFQVRCEEEYLQKKYGMVYVKYSRKTKRYIPLIY